MERAGDPDATADADGGGAVADDTRGGARGVGGGEGLCNRGWRVGKRVAFAGAAFSIAPVVVPPLLLLTAVGLAFSLPFGVFFAGYACTDRIMRSFLPHPVRSPGVPPPEGEEQENEDREEKGGEEEDGQFREVEADKGMKEMEMIEHEVGVREEEPLGLREEEGEGKLASGTEEERQAEEEEEEEFATLAGSDEVTISAPREEGANQVEEATKEEAVSPVTVSAHGEELLAEEKEKEDEGQAADQGKKPVEEGVAPLDMGKESIPVSTLEDAGAGEKVIEDKGQAQAAMGEGAVPDVLSILAPEVEEKHVEEKKIRELRDQEEESSVHVERVERESIAAPEGEEIADASPVVVVASIVEREILIELFGSSPGYTSTVEEQLTDVADADRTGSVGHPALQRPQCTAPTSQDADEGWYSEEKTWEQIDAIRMILGYGGPRHSSCAEELKTLYLFTGVELPISLEESPSLEEVHDKLWFLKSIIGIR